MAVSSMNRILIAFFAILITAVSCERRHLTQVDAGSGQGVIFTVIAPSAGDTVVHVRLQNQTRQRLIMRRSAAPTIQHNSLIVAVRESTHEMLPPTLELVAPPPGRTALDAGASIASDIDLRVWFPSLPNVLKNDNVVVFWAYNFAALSPPQGKRFYTGVTLSRQR
jgi:hypothetical protein